MNRRSHAAAVLLAAERFDAALDDRESQAKAAIAPGAAIRQLCEGLDRMIQRGRTECQPVSLISTWIELPKTLSSQGAQSDGDRTGIGVDTIRIFPVDS